LLELLLTAIGADPWVAVSVWGRAKLDWLRQFLPFENGIASRETFCRVFALLDAAVFSHERRYYLCSRLGAAAYLGEAVRGHWGVENQLDWSLDVVFGEGQARIRIGNAAEDLSVLRRIALILFRQEKTSKVGVKTWRPATMPIVIN
jgi:hypothetical protein